MPHSFETQPIEVERFYTGLITQRNKLAIPIRIMGRRIIELFDAILAGGDAELSVRSTFQRRCGYLQFNSNPLTGVPQKYYAFNATSQPNVVFPIVDTTTNVYYAQPGSAAPVNIITKIQPAQSSFFAVGNYLYIGNPNFSQKWDTGSPLGVSNWGISIGSIASTFGPNQGGAGTDTGSGNQGQGWTNPNNLISTTQFATQLVAFTGGSSVSNFLVGNTFGFSIPAGTTITGISVSFRVSQVGGGPLCNAHVTPLNSGNQVGISKNQIVTNTPTTYTLGGPSDLWGTSWVPNSIDQTTFGFQFQMNAGNGPGSPNYSINSLSVTVFGLGGPTVTTTGSGSFSATQGYQYMFVYGYSVDGNISNPTPPSQTTGFFSGVASTLISLTASTDPQVNQIRVFRTTDTGTGQVFFELPTSPYQNVTAIVSDSAADNQLIVQNAITVGSLAFSPPPPGLQLMEWYAGRMWGAVGNLLYFSAGPDNYPMGNGNSNWPPANVFPLPSTITKLIPIDGGNGMLVVTLDRIHVVQGISNPGFTVNVWAKDIGARQQNAVDSDGSTIYIFTSDRQFLQISSTGTNELTQYVSDVTDSYDPTQVYVSQHRSGSQDSRIFLSNGSTTILPYNLMSSAWEPVQTPVDGGGVGAIGSIEISPGVWKFLKGATSTGQLVLQRDQQTFTDNAVQYPWSGTFGNIPLADPTQLANVDSLVVRMTNAGVTPTVGILPNEISGVFTTLPNPTFEPPEGTAPPASYRALKYYLSQGTAWTQMTHLQIQFSFKASPFQEEILSWGLFPNQSADQAVGKIPEVQGR